MLKFLFVVDIVLIMVFNFVVFFILICCLELGVKIGVLLLMFRIFMNMCVEFSFVFVFFIGLLFIVIISLYFGIVFLLILLFINRFF